MTIIYMKTEHCLLDRKKDKKRAEAHKSLMSDKSCGAYIRKKVVRVMYYNYMPYLVVLLAPLYILNMFVPTFWYFYDSLIVLSIILVTFQYDQEVFRKELCTYLCWAKIWFCVQYMMMILYT
eukprot:UN20016